ncbi:MAG TPA: (d)CMP kinase [Planctomycetota bacterium]|nr:(d)CMP kinase [Planctomycetota bacterium]
MSEDFVVAIDGPAGAGKSTVARRVAEKLFGFRYLDTGAMYRAVTAYLLRIDKRDASEEEMGRAAEGLVLDGDRLLVHGVDVTGDIRSAAVTAEVSRVSAVPRVRRVVQGKQRAVKGRLVAEGRDIGSVVFPHAAVKVYLDAALDERARRRHRQVPEFSADEYKGQLAKRDRLDSTREDSPLVKAEDATLIDTTNLTIEQVVGKVEALVRERLRRGGGSAAGENG